jgi:hypothetical protein
MVQERWSYNIHPHSMELASKTSMVPTGSIT